MLNTYYSKLLKLSFAVLLAMFCIIGFTGNTSYAVTYDEFYTIMENNVGNSNQNIFNWWNGLKGQETTMSLMQTNWQQNGSLAVYGYHTNIYGWMGMVYFINNNGKVYRYNEGIKWTVGKDGYMGYSFTKSSFNLNSNGGNRNYFAPTNSDIINFGHIFNDSNTSWIFITDSEIYTDSTITEETSDTWYFKTYSLTSTNFEKYNSNLDYSDYYTYLGKITGEDLYVWRTRAILYQNGGIIASVNEIGLGGNNENGMIARKSDNIEDDDIYIYVRSSLLYPNKVYSLDVYYDEDESILEFNENYTFSLGSGDSGYTSQNSTNDIIQNQNQNTNDIVNAIESGNNFLNAPLDLSGENITSGDIIGALDMNFSGDPYQNVWTTLIDGLRNCLVGVDREFDIEINNRSYKISLDSFSIKLPAPLKTFLSLVSTTFMLWVLIRWIKLSIDKVQTANVDNLLQLNEEERYY